ncbi:MAG TPA: isoleucine--tRNA ligase [Elusimicrobiota bacterium]|nr:isoleucine--tRNA ligase [Elusimicrobiota bacterium]
MSKPTPPPSSPAPKKSGPSYSQTVNLPKTQFPMKADLPKREPEFLTLWEKQDVYERLLKKNQKTGRSFYLHDGPPYANGHIHMGHALNKVLKDIVIKYKSLQGFASPYIPGWDCHGLPIEHQLMKEKGWDKRKVSRVPFRQEAARYADHFIDIQRHEFKRLGILGDWDHPYRTMSPDYESAIVDVFYELMEKGYIYREKKPVYWCASCETALAEAEVEYETKSSDSIFVKFPVEQWPQALESLTPSGTVMRTSVLVWTTTPWTLPANTALAFHPERTYVLWESVRTNERFIVGEPGLKVLNELLDPAKEPMKTIDGLELEGLVCRNPLNNQTSQGVLADYVSWEDGTGIVHIAPGHGQDDYLVGREYGLPTISPVNDRGQFDATVLPNTLAGKSVWESNAVICDQLAKSHMLLKKETLTHSYPHCWRCKNPIIFRATPQWFLGVEKEDLRKKMLEAVGTVTWIPDYGRNRIDGMLQSRPDWCLSRQRYWGVPIPVFYCEECGEVLSGRAVKDHVVGLIEKHGTNVWFERSAADLLPPGTACSKGHKGGFKKEDDILDVWFDSGVSWRAVLQKRLGLKPGDRRNVMYLEGSDQHRGWFQTSLIPSVALHGAAPYEKVLTHGFVMDGDGYKMSKSAGNVIAPQEILDKYGADVLRLWVAMSDYREDIRLSQKILDHVVDTYRKIRNTARFMIGNLGDFDPRTQAVPLDKLEDIDRGVLDYLNGVISNVTRLYEANEFHLVSVELCDNLCIQKLSGYYLDVQKDILYCDRADSPRRRSAQTAFWHITQALARMMAPLLPFTAEEIWQTLKNEKKLAFEDHTDEAKSVLLNPFPTNIPVPPVSLLPDLIALREKINLEIEKSRQSGAVKGNNDVHVTVRWGGSDVVGKADPEKLAGLLGVSRITVTAAPDKDSTSVVKIEKSSGQKCDRCWVWRDTVGQDKDHPTLCARCADAVRHAPRPA